MSAETILPDLPLDHDETSSPTEMLSPKVERCRDENSNEIDGQRRGEGSAGTSGEAELRCPVCRRRFMRRYHLKRHIQMSSCSDDPGATFPCIVCSKVFAKQAKLDVHLKAHAERKDVRGDFRCDLCGRCYEGRSLLEIHRRSHTGDRPFPCPHCPMSFVSLGSLNKHCLKHTGARRHACPHCPLRFTLKGTLTRHLNTHAELLPFECPHCDRRYAQSGSLKSHLFTHTGRDGFSCQLCGRSFARKSSVRAHVRAVHRKERPHGCENCGKRYARRDDLRGHCGKCGSASQKSNEDLQNHSSQRVQSNDTLATQLESFQRKLKFQSILLNSQSRKRELSEPELCAAIEELLIALVEEPTLRKLGWPDLPTEELLEALIRRCGCNPAQEVATRERLRENCRVLFTAVLEDEVAKRLFGDYETADEVLERILQLEEW